MRICELSRRSGVSVRSLRYYEQKRLITSERLQNGYREFGETAVERVRAVQLYFGLGLSTHQIEHILNCQSTTALPERNPVCDGALSLFESKLEDINSQLDILLAVKAQLEARVAHIRASQREIDVTGPHHRTVSDNHSVHSIPME